MPVKRTRAFGGILVEFSKPNPMVWEELKSVLGDAGFSGFNTGIAQAPEGRQYPAYGCRKDGLELVYLPDVPHTTLTGEDPHKILSVFGDIIEGIQGLFSSSSKWDEYLSFIETNMNYEFEPSVKKPLQIMKEITPKETFAPFREAIGGNDPTMLLFRLAHWEGEVKTNIRKKTPWYDMQFFPKIENPDRFAAQIVCRSKDFIQISRCTLGLEESLVHYLESRDKEG